MDKDGQAQTVFNLRKLMHRLGFVSYHVLFLEQERRVLDLSEAEIERIIKYYGEDIFEFELTTHDIMSCLEYLNTRYGKFANTLYITRDELWIRSASNSTKKRKTIHD